VSLFLLLPAAPLDPPLFDAREVAPEAVAEPVAPRLAEADAWALEELPPDEEPLDAVTVVELLLEQCTRRTPARKATGEARTKRDRVMGRETSMARYQRRPPFRWTASPGVRRAAFS